jgi:hypothetical protein
MGMPIYRPCMAHKPAGTKSGAASPPEVDSNPTPALYFSTAARRTFQPAFTPVTPAWKFTTPGGGSGWNRLPVPEQRTVASVSVVSITIPDAFPHLVTVDWRADVRLKSQILTATDHHTFTTLPS